MKKQILTIIASIIIFAIILSILYLIIISGAIFSFRVKPPLPQVTYGEFPIIVTCQINGQTTIVEDIVVCEFDGYENLGSAGIYRKWKGYLKSGNERLVLLKGATQGITFEISDSYGLPDYYMGDYRYDVKSYEESQKNDQDLGYIQWENGIQTGYTITKDEAWEKYGLKIISVQYSQPIKNSFSER